MDKTLLLYELKVPIDKLEKASQQETAFFLRAMSVLNDISILQKAVLHSNAAMPPNNPNTPETSAQLAQSFCFIRMLAGICCETFNFMQVGFFANPGEPPNKRKLEKIKKLKLQSLVDIFIPTMSKEAKDANEKIQSYFSKSNLLKRLRNKFAFHYDLEQAFSQRKKLEIINDPHILLEEVDGNCCYVLSQQLMMLHALEIQKDDQNELRGKFEKLIDEVTSLAHAFSTFLNAYVLIYSQKYLAIDTLNPPKIKLENVSFFDEIRTPFFLKYRKDNNK